MIEVGTPTLSEKVEQEFRKVFQHSDKDEIIERLISGESVRQVEAWLKQKYGTQKKKQVSFVTLQKFRSQYLNIEADVLKDLQKQRKALELSRREEARVEQVKTATSYQASMTNYVQSSLIDYNQMILSLLNQCNAGIERLRDLDENKGTHLNHVAIAGYLGKIQDIMVMYNKMMNEQEKKSAGKVEADYETLKRQLEILKEVIKEVFLETNPEGLPIFSAKVRDRMLQAGLL